MRVILRDRVTKTTTFVVLVITVCLLDNLLILFEAFSPEECEIFINRKEFGYKSTWIIAGVATSEFFRF